MTQIVIGLRTMSGLNLIDLLKLQRGAGREAKRSKAIL
jgi:hypothetical protein